MSSPIISLSGKVALITGCTSGIGRETAILFKKLGATLFLTGRNEERLAALQTELTAEPVDGQQINALSADLASEADCRKLIQSVQAKYNKLDILVNNAGLLKKGTVETQTLEDYDYVMNVNLRAIFYLTQLATPMLKLSQGNVVNVSSVNGMRSFPGVLAYNISKAGLDQFTRCSALELAPYNVRVNSVNPGVTVTNIHKTGGMDEEAYKAFLIHSQSTHPLGRAGETTEVANTIAFLSSSAASFITGSTVPVDGGRHATCFR
uniref:3-oxoacyl-[acyl-carrier-protein] reductase FabG n=1 Tax=Rhabditophanes sp. KR3021 TaxID=114890 RepID=A0AC35U068_9BILA